MDGHEQTQQPAPAGNDGFLRIGRVQELLGDVSRSTVYELVKTAGLPGPIRLSPRHAVWVERDVRAWIAARIEAAREAKHSTAKRGGQ